MEQTTSPRPPPTPRAVFTSSVCVSWASLYLRFFQPHSTRIPAVLSHVIHFIFLISESLYECAAGCCQRRNLSAARCHRNHFSFPPQHDRVFLFLSVTLKPAKSIGFFSKSVSVRELACGFGFLCCAPVACRSMREVFCPCGAEALPWQRPSPCEWTYTWSVERRPLTESFREKLDHWEMLRTYIRLPAASGKWITLWP